MGWPPFVVSYFSLWICAAIVRQEWGVGRGATGTSDGPAVVSLGAYCEMPDVGDDAYMSLSAYFPGRHADVRPEPQFSHR